MLGSMRCPCSIEAHVWIDALPVLGQGSISVVLTRSLRIVKFGHEDEFNGICPSDVPALLCPYMVVLPNSDVPAYEMRPISAKGAKTHALPVSSDMVAGFPMSSFEIPHS